MTVVDRWVVGDARVVRLHDEGAGARDRCAAVSPSAASALGPPRPGSAGAVAATPPTPAAAGREGGAPRASTPAAGNDAIAPPPAHATGNDTRTEATAAGASAKHFAASLNAPRAARQFVAEVLGAPGTDAMADDAAVVVSELATNAVRHAGSSFTVTVIDLADAVRLAVSDTEQVPSDFQPPVSRRHGLGIVSTLARSWGVEPRETGKVVWAELTRRQGARPEQGG